MQTPITPESLDIVRSINLNPEDWHWATWRPRTPLTRPAPQPFDRSAALQKVKDVFVPLDGSRPPHMRYRVEWSRANISVALSPEEAYFWFAALNYSFDNTDPGIQELFTFLESAEVTASLSLDKAITTLLWSGRRTWKTSELVLPLAHFFEFDAVLNALVDLSLLNDEQLLTYVESRYDIPQFLKDQNYNSAMSRDYFLPIVTEKFRSAIVRIIDIAITSLLRYSSSSE